MKAKKIWIVWSCKADGFDIYSLWKNKDSAKKFLKERSNEDNETFSPRGFLSDVCDIKDYIGYSPKKSKVTEVTFKEVK